MGLVDLGSWRPPCGPTTGAGQRDGRPPTRIGCFSPWPRSPPALCRRRDIPFTRDGSPRPSARSSLQAGELGIDAAKQPQRTDLRAQGGSAPWDPSSPEPGPPTAGGGQEGGSARRHPAPFPLIVGLAGPRRLAMADPRGAAGAARRPARTGCWPGLLRPWRGCGQTAAWRRGLAHNLNLFSCDGVDGKRTAQPAAARGWRVSGGVGLRASGRPLPRAGRPGVAGRAEAAASIFALAWGASPRAEENRSAAPPLLIESVETLRQQTPMTNRAHKLV